LTVAELVTLVAQVSGLLFVVSSMLSMGMALTVSEVLTPLRSLRLVALALAINFVVVPLLAYAIATLLRLDEDLKVGLILVGTAAGAPFLPKLVQVARADIATAVGMMVLLMVVTVVYLPIALPLLLPGVAVDPWAIAKNLTVVMAAPLAGGLILRATAPETAAAWGPDLNRLSGIAILVLLVTGLGLNLSSILDLIGTGGLLAALLLIAATFFLGFVSGGRDPSLRSVLALGSAQRNVAAAILVAAQNFAGTATVAYVLVVAVLLLFILMPAARILGTRVALGGSLTG
jgi:BASS family bile acid:Na+ symporter